MTIKSIEEKPCRKIEIDLSSPEGNAFVLMAYAKQYAKQMQKDGNAIIKEMMSGNYENLINVFDREFGDFVTLYK